MSWTRMTCPVCCTVRQNQRSVPLSSRLASFSTNFTYMFIIWLEARLPPNIGFTLRGSLAVFTRLAITPPKVNRFGWNLEHCEYVVAGRPWQILGAICIVETVWEASEFFCSLNIARFYRFPVIQILQHLNTTTTIGVVMKISEQNFENFSVRSCFSKKTQKFLKILTSCDFDHAALITQWLQIVRNSLLNDPLRNV